MRSPTNAVELGEAARRLSRSPSGPASGQRPPGELALMRAVLQDAIVCYLGRAKRRRVDARILSREAEHWIRVKDWESPFSFNNVCEALGICHESARHAILAWKQDPDRVAGLSFLDQR